MENFILDENGEIDIKRKGVESNYEFWLNRDSEMCNNKFNFDDGTASVSGRSNSKLLIDAMFDERWEMNGNRHDPEMRFTKPQNNGWQIYERRSMRNGGEDKIEKLFEEPLSKSDWQNCDGDDAFRKNNGEKRQFAVTYMGSKPLRDKNLSLLCLQEPLKDIYMAHKRSVSGNRTNILTISGEGLKIKTDEKEELNPFSSIAVWTTVELTFRQTSQKLECAFVPLIRDPEGTDRNVLFKQVNRDDERTLTENCGRPAIFTIVMKNIHHDKRLECHCYICESSEEAITMAENLYRALVKKLEGKKAGRGRERENAAKDGKSGTTDGKCHLFPRDANEIDSSSERSDCEKVRLRGEREEKAAAENGSHGKCGGNGGKASAEAEVEWRRKSGLETHPSGTDGEPKEVTSREDCCRSDGDILTKVTIPRSGSFLNANGPLYRFPRSHNKNGTNGEITSPLGFEELFNEFEVDEGLENLDDILEVIIDAEGMSFNELRPIYKEFLLKLALTLTKDELYQRSKIIMKRQRKKKKRCHFQRNLLSSNAGLKKILNETARRMGIRNDSRVMNLKLTGSIVFRTPKKQFSCKLPNSDETNKTRIKVRNQKQNEKAIGTYKKRGKVRSRNRSRICQTKMHSTVCVGSGLNKSSSGYFSRSECSDSSEYYCTNVRLRRCMRCDENNDVTTTNEDSCSRDTESCTRSGKCHCNRWASKKRACDKPNAISNRNEPSSSVNFRPGNKNVNEYNSNETDEREFVSLPESNPWHVTWETRQNSRERIDNFRKRRIEFLAGEKKIPDRLVDEERRTPTNFPTPVRQRFDETINSREKCQGFCCFRCGIVNLSEKSNALRRPCFSRARRTRFNSIKCRQANANESSSIGSGQRTRGENSSGRDKNFDGNGNRGKPSNSTANNNNCLRFPKRMDVYNDLSVKNVFGLQPSSANNKSPKLKRTKKNEMKKFKSNLPNEKCDEPNNNRLAIPSERIDFASDSTRKKALMASERKPAGNLADAGREDVKMIEKAGDGRNLVFEKSPEIERNFCHSNFLKNQTDRRLQSKNTNVENKRLAAKGY